MYATSVDYFMEHNSRGEITSTRVTLSQHKNDNHMSHKMRRRTPHEVHLKTKRSISGEDRWTIREMRGRSCQTERPITLKKQMSLPSGHNFAYFYLESNQDFRFSGRMQDSIFDGSDLGVFEDCSPFSKIHHRKFSDCSKSGNAFFYTANWLQPGPIIPRNSPASGLVFQRSSSQPRDTREKGTRRKSDSLFNYVPKAFRDQEASKILMGETNEDTRRPSRHLPSAKAPDCETRQPSTRRVQSPNAGGVEDRKQGLNKNNVGEQPSCTESDDNEHFQEFDQNQNQNKSHFYFTPSVLMGRPPECDARNAEVENVNVAVLSRASRLSDQQSVGVTNDNDYNINNKSADEEVSAILKEFENFDRYNGNSGETVHQDNRPINQEFLY
ncbi:hypothetical protein Btru_072419 [Bulinus truncatus]|nr:hypothetical protein Btru_072419 [Bulinus truncatus]